ncbi:AAA family ATPase [Clostridium vitabionis]|uniref:AAA family ATPase n=1 Tax=Clostridium vitabionis TaxID=2784388 RepID=UPI00188C727A|nr:AAA family ATPase [Clostridium vitabionis]
MAEEFVRLAGVDIYNLKNVCEGHIMLSNNRTKYQSSILGVYGQNGSGKTTLIDALQILKYVLTGRPVPAQYAEYINVDADAARLRYEFVINDSEGTSHAFYEFSIKAVRDQSGQNLDTPSDSEDNIKVCVFDEVLKFSVENDRARMRRSTVMDTRNADIFLPESKYQLLFGDDQNVKNKLRIAKAMALGSSQSFLFSRAMIDELHKQENGSHPEEFELYAALTRRLVYFGNYELYVIDRKNTGVISINILPLSFQFTHEPKHVVGTIPLLLDRPTPVPEITYDVIKKVINNMNIVLTQIVPGLTIDMRDLGPSVMKNGQNARSIQLMSRKNSKEIPLLYESEGIKKIISILQLLIVVYNHPSITVAIDELDSGVYEYLLGELLRIISEKGKGQLIFTSHNLRPLETLDKNFILFTTTNPQNRYIRLSHVKSNNNLRDFYFRDIVLGEQKEEVYKPTNNAEIAFAFREAGEIFES